MFGTWDLGGTANVQVHVVPNSGGNAGTASSTTRIARLGISTHDTYFFENAYPSRGHQMVMAFNL